MKIVQATIVRKHLTAMAEETLSKPYLSKAEVKALQKVLKRIL
jgi:hypothetical protein